MSTGHGGGFPDYSGGYGTAQGGYGAGDDAPYGSEHGAPWQGGLPVEDPYAVGPGGVDPYARDPLSADGYGPVFSSDPYGTAGHGAAPSTAQHPGAHPAGSPGYGHFPPAPPSSGSAIAGFVLGLLGITMCSGLTAPFGIIFSAMGMKETGPGATTAKGGRGFAIAGLVTSLIGLLPLALVLFYIVMVIVMIASGTITS